MYIDKDKSEQVLKPNFSRTAIVEFFLIASSFLAARVLVFDAASPFALAYISTFLFRGTKFYVAALFSALGVITSFRAEFSMKYLLTIILLCLANLFLSMRPKMAASVLQASVVAIVAVISGFALIFIRGQGMYYFAINLLEAALIFALAIVISKGISCVAPRAKRKPLSNEELIAVAVLVGILAVGTSDVHIWQLSFRYFFAMIIVLLSAQSGGAAIGAASGILLGFLLNLTGFEYIYFAVLLAVCGFAAGSVRKYNKLFQILAFVLAGVACILYFDISLLTTSLLFSSIAAATSFYFLPTNLLLNIHASVNPATQDTNDYIHTLKNRIVDRVHDFASGYGKLSSMFEIRSVVQPKSIALKTSDFSESMKNDFCLKCHRHNTCWKEKSEKMKAHVAQLVAKSEKLGKIDIEDAPLDLSATCIAPVDFVRSLWAQISRSHFEKDLEVRLTETRALVAQQFQELSIVMYEFADELDTTLNSRKESENRIISELQKQGIEVENVIVIENKRGKYEISLSAKRKSDIRQTRDISMALSRVTGRDMSLVGERFDGRVVHMEFFEKHKFYVHSGVAKASKGTTSESGDSFSLIQLKDGRCLAALSDGMGSGKKAKEESEIAIELLEELMERGFEREITMRLINSALLMKSGEESFSTLDICLLDMGTGLAEFVKVGAAASYLMRAGEVSAIGSWTLPVGILESIDIDVQKKQLGHGDIVVMMTDGVADSLKGVAAKRPWIENLLTRLRTGNPQDIAEKVISAAKDNYGDEVGDDMTVMVLRISERG
ncbi:MAG: stage II sporulation protein E [Defluviitaleaceae bacterium]|nr:stage II sporulation protein E [Defluviitaleaceae bacterium]